MSSFAAGIAVLALAGVAAAGAGAAPTTGYLAAPTEQLAVPGMAAGAEVTPEGDLYTGWAEYELRFGERLRAWDQPTRTLPDPGVPLLSSALADGPVRYTETLFAVPVAGRPVAYETVTAANGSGRPQEAQVAMVVAYTRGRQIRGPHGVLTGAFRYERPVSGQRRWLLRHSRASLLPDLSATPSPAATSTAPACCWRAARPLRAGRWHASAAAPPPRRHDGAGVQRSAWTPTASVSFTWQIPLDPPPAGAGADRALDAVPLGAARAALRSLWAAQEAG